MPTVLRLLGMRFFIGRVNKIKKLNVKINLLSSANLRMR